MSEQSTPTSDDVALSWANEISPVLHQKLISDHPWSKVYRLFGEDDVSYLKLIPVNGKQVIEKNLLIHKKLKRFTPEIKAHDKKLGTMILREHGSISLGEFSSEYQISQLLEVYARVQSDMTGSKKLSKVLPEIKVSQLFDKLLDFFNPEATLKEGVGSTHFLDDPQESIGYYIALSDRRDFLERYLKQVEKLPNTLNHCDLHTDNVSETEDGDILIYDWDDAAMGPAGISLYRMFNGASIVYKLLETKQQNEPIQDAQRAGVQGYITRLSELGYADADVIRKALPAAACLGAMNSIVSYQQYPKDDYFYQKDISNIIRNRVEDIVHLCDLLALRRRKDTLHFTQNYLDNNAPWRATYLLNEFSKLHPSDMAINHYLAHVQMQSGQWDGAVHTLQEIIEKNPDNVEARKNYGISLIKNGRPDLALRELEFALQLHPDQPDVMDYINKASEIMHWKNRARVPHLIPTLSLSDQELQTNTISEEKMRLAIEFYREFGVVVIENAFPRKLIEDISEIVFDKYNSYFEDRPYEDNLVLGDKRRMVTLSIEGALNSPRLYGSEVLKGVMHNLLGSDHVMGGLNAVISLPGSRDQGLHKDYTPLFNSEQDNTTHVTPSFATAALIPLIDVKREHGVTCFRKGSHLVPEQAPYEMPTQDVMLKMTDCVIFDYRVAHEGLANRSEEVRPLLSVIYHRVWFRDALNYELQKDVMISPEEFEKVPEELKGLFRWVH